MRRDSHAVPDACRRRALGRGHRGTAQGMAPLDPELQWSQRGETDNNLNPFLDYRLQVRFTSPDGREFVVPGFFDGDGKGGGSGACWRVRFAPDRPGNWLYRASFRVGPRVAIDLGPEAGMPVSFDGASGMLAIAARDPAAPGFLKWGRLKYAGGYYLKFQDGPYWIKGGTNEPENLLAYKGFDDTVPSHAFDAHADDWRPGDPDWGAGKGKALIGLLNYLSAHHVNSIYFMTMNIGGDGQRRLALGRIAAAQGLSFQRSPALRHQQAGPVGGGLRARPAQRNSLALRLERKRRGQQART